MAQTEIIEIKAKTDKAAADIKKLKGSIEGTKVASQETNETIQKGTGVVDKYTGGAISGFKQFTSTIKTAVKSLGVLRLAVAATGLGALVLLVTSIQQAFTRSEEGQNKYAKLLGQISAVTGELLDRLANLGTSIIDAFTNPRKALEDFGKSIKQFFLDRIKLATEGIGLLGSAIKKVFEGDFKGAAIDAGKGFLSLNRGINPTFMATELLVKSTAKLVEVTKEATKAALEEAKIAGQIADLRAKADKVERQLLVNRAEANRRIAELRELAANKESVAVQERLKALREAAKVEDEITAKEIAAAKLRLEAKQAENALGLSTKDDLNEEAQLKARVIELETSRLNTQKRLAAELTSAIREQAAEEKAIQAEIDAAEKERKDQIAKENKERAEEEKRIEEERVAAKTKALDAIISLTNKETALGKAALVAKQLLAAEELLIDLGVLKNKATTASAEASLDGAKAGQNAATGLSETLKLGFPKALPFLILYATQAFSIVKGVISAVKKTKSVAASVGGQSSGAGATASAPAITPTQAPAFNIVGTSSTNQLAETIAGQQQQPVKAFVVANDVTTAQSLERNTIQGATI